MTTSRTASAPALRSSSAPGLLRSCGFSEEYELLFADELECRHGQLRRRRTQRSRRIGDALKAAACLERESIQIRGQLKPEAPGRGVVYTFSDQESGLPKIRRRGAGFDYICFSGRLTGDCGRVEGGQDKLRREHPEDLPALPPQRLWAVGLGGQRHPAPVWP